MLKRKDLYFLVFFLVLLSLFQITQINDFYSYGDDFAQYILQSKSLFDSPIAEYELQANLNSFSNIQIGPNSYPVGYPLVLKFIEVFSNGEFKYYKLANIFFFNLYIFFTYLILFNKSKIYAIFVTLLISLSNEIFNLSHSIESDLMFGLFCIISIYFLDKEKYILALIVCMFTLIIKLQGVVLLLAITFFLFQKKILKQFINVYLVFFILYMIIYFSKFKFLLGEYKDHLRQFSPYFSNLKYNLDLISTSFLPSFINYQFLSFIILIVFIYVSIKLIINFNSPSIHYLVFAGYFLFFSLYLNQQGIRFLLVLIPSMFIIVYELLKKTRFKDTLTLFIFSLLILINSSQAYKIDYPDEAFGESSSKLYEFITNVVKDEDYVAFEKPRLLRLSTNKKGVFLDQSSLLNKPEYVVVKKEESEKFYEHLKIYSLIMQIDKYYVYEINENN